MHHHISANTTATPQHTPIVMEDHNGKLASTRTVGEGDMIDAVMVAIGVAVSGELFGAGRDDNCAVTGVG